MFELALGYILLWLVALNTALGLPARWQLASFISITPFTRYFEWLWRAVVLLAIGMWLDKLTYSQPHAAYEQWEFYATYLAASVVASLPGFFIGQRKGYRSA